MMPSSLDFYLDLPAVMTAYRITDTICSSLINYSEDAHEQIPKFLDGMKEWIMETGIFKPLETNLQQFLENQDKYWNELFEGSIDEEYISSRLEMGKYYAHASLPLSAYCALISYRLSWWMQTIHASNKSQNEKVEIAEALKRLILLDTGITCAAYMEASNSLIEAQSDTLLQLSTPTIQLWEGILLLPIVGVLDSVRAQNMMDELLKRTVSSSSPVSIIDIAGVPNVDSSVANHLIKIVKAAKLLGSTCILSGISPEVAQALVEVGINLDEVNTTSTLRNAFLLGLKIVGMSIHRDNK